MFQRLKRKQMLPFSGVCHALSCRRFVLWLWSEEEEEEEEQYCLLPEEEIRGLRDTLVSAGFPQHKLGQWKEGWR